LGYHFPQLELKIVFKGGIGDPGSHERNLLPYDITPSVRLFEHEVRLGIVGESK